MTIASAAPVPPQSRNLDGRFASAAAAVVKVDDIPPGDLPHAALVTPVKKRSRGQLEDAANLLAQVQVVLANETPDKVSAVREVMNKAAFDNGLGWCRARGFVRESLNN